MGRGRPLETRFSPTCVYVTCQVCSFKSNYTGVITGTVRKIWPSCPAYQGHSRSVELIWTDRLPMTSYNHGDDGPISCLQRFRSKIAYFARPVYLMPPPRESHRNFATAIELKKLGSYPYQTVKRVWRYMQSCRYNTTTWRTNGQTDGRTDGRICWNIIALCMQSITTRDKNTCRMRRLHVANTQNKIRVTRIFIDYYVVVCYCL